MPDCMVCLGDKRDRLCIASAGHLTLMYVQWSIDYTIIECKKRHSFAV